MHMAAAEERQRQPCMDIVAEAQSCKRPSISFHTTMPVTQGHGDPREQSSINTAQPNSLVRYLASRGTYRGTQEPTDKIII